MPNYSDMGMHCFLKTNYLCENENQINDHDDKFISLQAMPQLTDRSKLPNIVDPAIKNTMDLKHLYQVRFLSLESHIDRCNCLLLTIVSHGLYRWQLLLFSVSNLSQAIGL